MRGLDYLAQLTLDEAPAPLDGRPTIGSPEFLAHLRAALAIYESVYERLAAANAEFEWNVRSYRSSTAERELKETINSMRRDLKHFGTPINVVLELEFRSARLAKEEGVPHILRGAKAWPPGWSYGDGEERGFCGVQGKVDRRDWCPGWTRLCRACSKIALSGRERAAVEEADRRNTHSIRVTSVEYDRGLYAEHYRINGVVY